MHCKAYDIFESAIVPLVEESDALFYFKGKKISAASQQNLLFEFETSDKEPIYVYTKWDVWVQVDEITPQPHRFPVKSVVSSILPIIIMQPHQ